MWDANESPSQSWTQVTQVVGRCSTTRGVNAGARQNTERIASTSVGRYVIASAVPNFGGAS